MDKKARTKTVTLRSYWLCPKRCVEIKGHAPEQEGRFTLFINDRLVESTAIKRCVDEVMRTDPTMSLLRQTPSYLSLKVPGSHVDVNVHPKKSTFFVRGGIVSSAATAPLVAHADTRTLAQLSDVPLDGNRRHSRRPSPLNHAAGRAPPGITTITKRTTNTQPSQRPEKMIRADYRDQQQIASFRFENPAPPPSGKGGHARHGRVSGGFTRGLVRVAR